MYKVPIYPHPCQNSFSSFLVVVIHSGFEMLFVCAFDLFSRVSDVENIFRFLIAICIYSLKNCLCPLLILIRLWVLVVDL